MKKFALKKIYHSERLSEETNAYKAELWLGNRCIGWVSNSGHGESDHVEYVNNGAREEAAHVIEIMRQNPPGGQFAEARRRIQTLIRIGDDGFCENDLQYPDEEMAEDDRLMAVLEISWMDVDIENICQDLLVAHLQRQELMAHLRKRILFTKPGERAIYQTNTIPGGKKRVQETARSWAAPRVASGEIDRCLNLMPLEESETLYREGVL